MTQMREYKVYYESELSLGIAIGPEVIPHGAEVFSVREVLDGDVKRERLIQDLLDAVDAFSKMDGSYEWTDVMQAREALK